MSFATWLMFAVIGTPSLIDVIICGNDNATDRALVQSASLRGLSCDDDSVTAVLGQFSLELLQLKAEVSALRMGQANCNKMAAVSFTARFSQEQVRGLRKDQVVVFDLVLTNIGNGYNPATGLFTAPVAGSYVFFLGMQRLGSEESTFIAFIMKESTPLLVAEAGYSPYEHGSMLVTTHLERGETVSVKVYAGSVVYGGLSTAFSGFLISP